MSGLSSLVLIQRYSSDIEMKVEGCRFSPLYISRFILHAPPVCLSWNVKCIRRIRLICYLV